MPSGDLLLTTGPVPLSPRVQAALARPTRYHYDPGFLATFEYTRGLLQRVFRTGYETLILGGEALLGLEAAAVALIAPGDAVLNLVSGIYGKGYQGYIERAGGRAIELAVPYNEAIDPDDVRAALHAHPEIRLLSVVHGETPSGTLNPLSAIGAVARDFEVPVIADVVATLGGEPFSPEEFGVDVAVAGSQKCLGAPSGLALLAISPRAWEWMAAHPRPVRNSYLSLLDWQGWREHRRFPYAPPVNLIGALETALEELLEEGLDRAIARHAAIARACRAGVRAMGLHLWPAREAIAAHTVTSIALPPGLRQDALLDALRSHHVVLSRGEGPLAETTFRIAHAASSATSELLLAALDALEGALGDLGQPVARRGRHPARSAGRID